VSHLAPSATQIESFSNNREPQNHLEGLLKHKLLGITPVFLIQSVWEWPENLHFFNKRPDGAEAVVTETRLLEPS
jgi:hypothetical protein